MHIAKIKRDENNEKKELCWSESPVCGETNDRNLSYCRVLHVTCIAYRGNEIRVDIEDVTNIDELLVCSEQNATWKIT